MSADPEAVAATEAGAVAVLAQTACEPTELAQTACEPTELDTAKTYSVVVPDGSTAEILDLERRHPQPFRKRGTVNLTTGESLSAYTATQGAKGATALYADQQTLRVVAVLNGHTTDEAGWGDHRAVFQVRETPEWKHWKSRDGLIGSQVDFAEHVEAGLPEIITPDGATMLELAQTFHAKTGVDFKSHLRLDSGERQLRYEEDMTASAGRTPGSIDIPETFVLSLAPFEGAEVIQIQARIRYRIANGHLSIGYALVRPDDVVRDGFERVVQGIETATKLTAFRGTPPS